MERHSRSRTHGDTRRHAIYPPYTTYTHSRHAWRETENTRLSFLTYTPGFFWPGITHGGMLPSRVRQALKPVRVPSSGESASGMSQLGARWYDAFLEGMAAPSRLAAPRVQRMAATVSLSAGVSWEVPLTSGESRRAHPRA